MDYGSGLLGLAMSKKQPNLYMLQALSLLLLVDEVAEFRCLPKTLFKVASTHNRLCEQVGYHDQVEFSLKSIKSASILVAEDVDFLKTL